MLYCGADKAQSLGSFFSAQLAVQQMKKQGTPGSVVMIASITSHINLPAYRMAGYNMSEIDLAGGCRDSCLLGAQAKVVSAWLRKRLPASWVRVTSE